MSPIAGVVSQWSAAGYGIRLVVLAATGLAWTVVSVQSVLFHPDFWDPVTFSDWFAVWAYTTTWLLTAAAVLVFREVAGPDTLLRTTLVLVAVACATTGIANALEDGFRMPGFGSVYVVGILSACVGLVLVAAMTWAGPVRRLSFVPLLGAAAAFTTTLGGGPLALIAWLGFAVVLVRARRSTPTR